MYGNSMSLYNASYLEIFLYKHALYVISDFTIIIATAYWKWGFEYSKWKDFYMANRSSEKEQIMKKKIVQ